MMITRLEVPMFANNITLPFYNVKTVKIYIYGVVLMVSLRLSLECHTTKSCNSDIVNHSKKIKTSKSEEGFNKEKVTTRTSLFLIRIKLDL